MSASREQRIGAIVSSTRSRRSRFRDERITMAHGAGGKSSQSLIEGLVLPTLEDEQLEQLADAGTIELAGRLVALTSDSFVVNPINFPGGSIGTLAVNGTVNDLAVSGARPLALTLSLILEEGLEASALSEQLEAIAQASRRAGVRVISGDTKVVERGQCDRMYICTSGLGLIDARCSASPSALQPGDLILLSGPIGAHGTAVMLAREQFALEAEIESDTHSLWPAVDALLASAGGELHAMRDATRGGLASVLNELARASDVGVLVRELDVPVLEPVAGACELLGIDPMYVANEGALAAFLAPAVAERALAALRAVPGHEQAALIGEVTAAEPGMVLVETSFGGRRVMDLLAGDPLPRIC